VADELFFTGTAAEVTPIRSVDKIKIGAGKRGEITARIQQAYFEITKGERPAPGEWLTYVKEAKASVAQPGNNGYGSTSAGTGLSDATEAKISESFLTVGTE
jgi:hypothetical protein